MKKRKTRFSDKFLNKEETKYFFDKVKEYNLLQKQIAQPFGLDISAVRLTYSSKRVPRYYLQLIKNLELEKKTQELESKLSNIKKCFKNFMDVINED